MSELSQNNTKNGKLLPCPFCGGEAEAVHEISGFWTVECTECGALVDGIAAWNTRTEYHGYEQAAIEAWESIKKWNTRAERTCRDISDEYNEKEIGATSFYCSECGAHYEDAESYYAFLVSDDGITHWCPSCGAKVVGE